jgi:hypothetical protein
VTNKQTTFLHIYIYIQPITILYMITIKAITKSTIIMVTLEMVVGFTSHQDVLNVSY